MLEWLAAVVVGGALFAAGAATGYRLARSATDRSEAAQSQALERVIHVHEDVVSKLFMVRGLHPHLAAPREFTATGISRQDTVPPDAVVETDSVDNPGEDEDDRGQFEAEQAEWLKRLDDQRKEKQSG